MGLFGRSNNESKQQPPAKDPFQERVENHKKEMGLNGIYGAENQRSFDFIISNMCELQDLKNETKDYTSAKLEYIIMRQQEAIIEQNNVIIRLLADIRSNADRRI